MLWTVLKILLFMALVAGLALGADHLLENGQGLRIAFESTEFTLGPVQVALAALILLAGLWLLLKLAGLTIALLRFLQGDETAISRYFARTRQRRGVEALTEGMIALAEGDGPRALSKARKAEALLDQPDLTRILLAQAASVKGDTALAEETYRQLLASDRTRFVAVQGLMQQRLASGETDTARALAQKALALRPGHGSTQDQLLRLQQQGGDWQGARDTLRAIAGAGRLPRPVYRRRDAVLALQQAETLMIAGQTDRARDLAIEANTGSPDLVPAAVLAASGLAARGETPKAAKVLKKAWAAMPHPDLARAYADLEPGETPVTRLGRFEKLLGEDDESALTRAELLIAVEDFPAARRALGARVETDPTQRVVTIMAAIARGEGEPDDVVRGWLARALTAHRGPVWICDKCQHIHAGWQAICDHCEGFDTLSWRRPPDSGGASPSGTEMLPLIVAPRVIDAVAETPLSSAPATANPGTPDNVAPTPDTAQGPETRESRAGSAPDVIDLAQARRSGL
jgi:HemY protein